MPFLIFLFSVKDVNLLIQVAVTEKIILGIDPGSVIMGYGVIAVSGQKIRIVEMGVLKLSKYPDASDRLNRIFNRVHELCEQYKPESCAIEAPFFGKNVQSMLKLGRAQGVAMAAGLSREVPITEYAPKKIKMAITGKGTSSKEQVAMMLKSLLNLKTLPKNLDATDGLAAAVCHFYNSGKIVGGKNYTGWASFVKQNDKRVKK